MPKEVVCVSAYEPLSPAGGEAGGECLHFGRELIPQLQWVAHREFELQVRPACLSAEGPVQLRRRRLVVFRRGLQDQTALDLATGQVADGQADFRHLAVDVRIDADGLEPDRVGGLERDPADDAVPVGLRFLRNRGCEGPEEVLDRVVHADGQAVFPGSERGAEVVEVRGGQAVLGPEVALIHPHLGFPVAALQEERDTLALPASGNSRPRAGTRRRRCIRRGG